MGGVRFGDTDYMRGRKYVSRIIAARVSLCSLRVDISIGQISPFEPVCPSIECKGSVSPSLTDKTTVFALYTSEYRRRGPFIDPSIIGTPPLPSSGLANTRTSFSRIIPMGTEISKVTAYILIFNVIIETNFFLCKVIKMIKIFRQRSTKIGTISIRCSIP